MHQVGNYCIVKFPVFCETRILITALTRSCHWHLLDYVNVSHALTFSLILSSHLHLYGPWSSVVVKALRY